MLYRFQTDGRRLIRPRWSVPLVALALCLTSPLLAQEATESEPQGHFLEKVYEDEQGCHRYQVFLPAGYDKQQKYPTILYLHGSEDCGDDGKKPVRTGLGPYVLARKAEYPFIVVFPQCETTQGRRYLERWQAGSPDATSALKILGQVVRDYSVDRSHEIVTGWSMGAYGAWSLAMANPSRWAAVVPVSGGGDTTRVSVLKDLPIWVVHGPNDRVVYPERAREMVAALKKAGGRVRYDEPQSEAHAVWQRAYDSEALETWLKNPREPFPGSDVKLVARGTPLPPDLMPFVPVAHIGGAAYLRVGREMIDAIAAAIPTAVPDDFLSGKLDSVTIQDEVKVTRGKKRRYYNEVFLEQISYRGEISAAELSTFDNGTLRVRMELKKITVVIARTQIDDVTLSSRRINRRRQLVEKGRKTKAVAGTSQILIGHKKPVLLEFVIKPTVAKRRLSLGLTSTVFEIDPEQYEVVGPEEIEVKGLAQDSKRTAIFDAIVSGLAGQRELVAKKIRELVPSLLIEMEQQLTEADASGVLGNLWPLPVFKPRVRLWPEALVLDKSGLSVAMGLTVAASDPSASVAKPRELVQVKDLIKHVPKTQTLQLGFAPGLLDPLTRIAIDGGMARVDVRDTPEPLVQKLGDRGELSKVIPAIASLPSTTEVRTEFALTRPISITPTDKSTSVVRSSMGFRFQIPGAQLIVSTRDGGDWKSLAVFDLSLEHAVKLKLLDRPPEGGQPLEISLPTSPKITMSGSLSPGAEIADRRLRTERLQEQFDQAWRAFVSKALESKISVSDFEIGDVRFPLKDIGWSSPLMSIEFGLPGK